MLHAAARQSPKPASRERRCFFRGGGGGGGILIAIEAVLLARFLISAFIRSPRPLLGQHTWAKKLSHTSLGFAFAFAFPFGFCFGLCFGLGLRGYSLFDAL